MSGCMQLFQMRLWESSPLQGRSVCPWLLVAQARMAHVHASKRPCPCSRVGLSCIWTWSLCVILILKISRTVLHCVAWLWVVAAFCIAAIAANNFWFDWPSLWLLCLSCKAFLDDSSQSFMQALVFWFLMAPLLSGPDVLLHPVFVPSWWKTLFVSTDQRICKHGTS